MNKSILKKSMIMKIFDKSLVSLPTPVNISMFWNFGSMLGVMLIIQITTGILLSLHYCPNIDMAFNSIIHIMQDVNKGWLIRNIHMNGASMFFFLIYFHIGRSLYYSSYFLSFTWIFGISILLVSMMTAFLGYILPWGQMSFWGATVITNLISVVPYFGNSIVFWVWGGFSINNATLNRFYSFHFIFPFLILMLVIIHLMYLHQSGSSNPLGSKSDLYKIPFHNYFSLKDILGFIIMLMILMILVLSQPYMLSDPDNFTPASSLNTPIHIQPEWYFLFAYAILRSIPNKLGGVIALMLSILILSILPFNQFKKIKSFMFFPLNQGLFWMFCCSFCILTWSGSNPIDPPYIIISQLTSFIYFSYFFISPLVMKLWKTILFN